MEYGSDGKDKRAERVLPAPLHHSNAPPFCEVMPERRNRNRGYQQLRVWQQGIELYRLTCAAVQSWPFERKKIAAQAISSSDSVHRNIAEGYCRRSIREYLNFLNIALGSLGETVSGYHAYHSAGQLDDATFESLDSLAYQLENGLLRLVATLEQKRRRGDWIDTLTDDEEGERGRSGSDGVME
jgi:four helix bundle protein